MKSNPTIAALIFIILWFAFVLHFRPHFPTSPNDTQTDLLELR